MRALIDLLSKVEELPSRESGALVLDNGGPQIGSIFAENNRVCWVAAAGRSRRLRDLLSRYSRRPLDAAALEEVFVWCRSEGRPFGETLVERGMCTAETLGAALRRHTIESLQSLSQMSALNAGWKPHRCGGYRAAFTMSPADLIAALGAEGCDDHADLERAHDGLCAITSRRARGASFLRRNGDPILVHIQPSELGGAKALLALGEWATAGLEVSGGFNRAVLARGIAGACGEITLGWRSSPYVVHAAIFDDPDSLAHACAELERRAYPTVFATQPITADLPSLRGQSTKLV